MWDYEDVILKIFYEDTFLKTFVCEILRTFVCEILRTIVFDILGTAPELIRGGGK
jgi:hypothetical protein